MKNEKKMLSMPKHTFEEPRLTVLRVQEKDILTYSFENMRKISLIEEGEGDAINWNPLEK